MSLLWGHGQRARLIRVVHAAMRGFTSPCLPQTDGSSFVSMRAISTIRRQKAAFWRGGTSNGIMISGANLPEWQTIKARYPLEKVDLKDCAQTLEPVFRAIMGSPDPYGRQLNGMGGGLSSLSKAVIVDRSTSKDCDLDYMFIQVGSKSSCSMPNLHTCNAGIPRQCGFAIVVSDHPDSTSST